MDRKDDSTQTDQFYIPPGGKSTETHIARRSMEDVERSYRPVLICLSGAQRGQRRSLNEFSMVVGRSSTCDWPLADDASSRFHLRIEYENHSDSNEMPRCYAVDLGSRNGTQLNGQDIAARTLLRERDRLLIGSTVIGFFVRDDAEMRHDESLYLSATSDVLTGLDNRRQLQEHMKFQLARASRQETPLSFLLLDIDHFKTVNDKFGHDVGDEALIHTANIIRRECRETDLCGRWGGEEFAVCVPDATMDQALYLAERIRRALEHEPLESKQGSVSMTISIGVASYEEGDSIDTLFQRADQMLYRAKEGGRNMVVSSVPQPEFGDK